MRRRGRYRRAGAHRRRMGGAKRYPSMPPVTWVGDGFRCALPILRNSGLSTSLRAKRSNPSIPALNHGLLRCARNDGGILQTYLRLLAAHCARAVHIVSPSKEEGAGNAGCRLAPAVSCAMCTRKCAHEHTGTAGAARHSLRDGFTAYTALSLETNSFCLHRRRIEGFGKPGWIYKTSAGLTPATGARTTRLCRPHQHRSSARGLRSRT